MNVGKLKLTCDFCGNEIERYRSQVKPHNFCSRECLGSYSNKAKNPEHYNELKDLEPVSRHMSELNRKMNPSRMTPEIRAKLRASRIKKDATSYPKLYGVHEHRIVMEHKLGRKLRLGEVVHHIDGNKRNNDPNNLMLFASQAEHAAWHQAKRGDDL